MAQFLLWAWPPSTHCQTPRQYAGFRFEQENRNLWPTWISLRIWPDMIFGFICLRGFQVLCTIFEGEKGGQPKCCPLNSDIKGLFEILFFDDAWISQSPLIKGGNLVVPLVAPHLSRAFLFYIVCLQTPSYQRGKVFIRRETICLKIQHAKIQIHFFAKNLFGSC